MMLFSATFVLTAMKNKGMEKDNSNSSFLFVGFKNWEDGTV